MPTVLRLRLRLFKDVSVPLAEAPAHGWALALIKQHDPAWSSELHPDPKPNAHKNSSAEKPRGQAPGPEGPGARPESAGVPVDEAPQPGGGAESAPPPFTTSPLYRPAGTLDQDEFRLRARALRADDPDDRFAKALVCAGEVVALRLAFADDERARQLCSEWIMGEIPFLADAPCELVRAPTFSRGDPDLCYRPWPALADAPPARRLQVSFQTPTTYSHRGTAFTSLDLSRLEKSWRRALKHVPPEFKADWASQFTTQGLETEGLEVDGAPETASLFLKNAARVGFVGDLKLIWRLGTPPGTRRAFAALAGLADFFGTGAKTALGMGQTRVRLWE